MGSVLGTRCVVCGIAAAMLVAAAWAQGQPAETNRLTSLTVQQARILVSFHDDEAKTPEQLARNLERSMAGTYGVELNGLMSVSDEVAFELGRSVEGIELDGLSSLSAGAARNLARCKGTLSLNGLSELSAEAARGLARPGKSSVCNGLELNGLKTLPADVAAGLARHAGDLELDGLKTLSPEAAAALAKHRGLLRLEGLQTIPDEVARALGEHEGVLRFLRVQMLSDAAAVGLARHRGEVHFPILTKFSVEAATALKANPAIKMERSWDPRWLQGERLAEQRDYEGALAMFRQMAAAEPKWDEPEFRLGLLSMTLRQPGDAIRHFARAVELDPKDRRNRRGLAEARLLLGDREGAIAEFQKLLEQKLDDAAALNALAWLLATAPETRVRDGRRAIDLARKACDVTAWKEAAYVSTLAAGYAEIGDFESARKFSRQSVTLAGDDAGMLESLGKELASYERNEPWRERAEEMSAPSAASP